MYCLTKYTYLHFSVHPCKHEDHTRKERKGPQRSLMKNSLMLLVISRKGRGTGWNSGRIKRRMVTEIKMIKSSDRIKLSE